MKARLSSTVWLWFFGSHCPLIAAVGFSYYSGSVPPQTPPRFPAGL